MKLLTFTLLTLGTVFAQSAETIPFRAVMAAANETTPIVDRNATGTVNILLHVVRDATGKIVSGSVDFAPTYRMSGATTFTAMHIHKAPAGTAGGIVVPVPLTRFDDATGIGIMERKQVQFTAADATIMDSVNGILADPSQFYFNIHTADAPSGAMRGQLQRVQQTVLMGLMSPANENPPIAGSNASAVATVLGIRTVPGAPGAVAAGSVIFDINYTGFPEDTVFTGLHIHYGVAGVNAGVTIDSGISANNPVNGGASGNLHYEFDVDMARALAPESLAKLFDDPSGVYINLHTRVSPGGAIRAQLHRTDHTIFDVNANTREEIAAAPITAVANAQSQIHVYTLRNPDGTAPAGALLFDINPRFAAPATVTAMHIHDAIAGLNGSVTLDGKVPSVPLMLDNGNGNITRLVTYSTAAAVSSLNDVLVNPEKHYFNLHTSANPGGVIRAQLAVTPIVVPVVTAAISSVSDVTRTNAAPKALMSVYGLNLARATANLEGFLQLDSLPKTVNGTSVTIGGTPAGLMLVSPGQLIVEVPAEVTAGSQPMRVTTPGGTSTFNLPVLASAPNIFFDATGGIVTKTNYTLVRADNTAAAGDILLIFSTGNGGTTPALATGRVTPTTPLFNAPTPTVTIGGRAADVIYSVAAPGYPGLYQTAVRMPTAVPAGRAAVQMTIVGNASNSVNIDVR